MQTLWQVLRYAVRMLMKNRGFTAVAVLTLAVAIGANAVVFGVLNALIIRPLHVPHAETLWGLESIFSGSGRFVGNPEVFSYFSIARYPLETGR